MPESLLFGIGTLRAHVAPRLAGWLLTLGGFPGIIVLSALVDHNAIGLLLALAGILIGWQLWRQPERAIQPQPLMA
jgi:hypothetical protein